MPEQNDKDTTGEKNKIVKISVDELTRDNIMLKAENDALKAENKTLKEARIETDAFLETQIRAKLGTDLQRISKFSVEDIDKMSTEDLQTTLNTLMHSSVLKKPMLATEGDTEKDTRLTVGELFAAPLRSKAEAS